MTIGGYSVLDGANVTNMFTTFIVYEDWSRRGAELNQDQIVNTLRGQLQAIEESFSIVLVPPPIRGLGQGGGFQMMLEDRQSLGLGELQKAVDEVIRIGNTQSGLRNLSSTLLAIPYVPVIYVMVHRGRSRSPSLNFKEL